MPVLPVSRETGPSPGERRHTVHVSPEAHCRNQIRRIQRAASVRPGQSRCIYQVLSTAAGRLPPTGHDLLNGRPLPGTENRHQVGLTCYGICPTCPRREAITSQPAAWNHAFAVSETSADVSRNTAVGCFTIGFT